MTSTQPNLHPSFQYIPALDGLRACAVAVVLVAHFGLNKWVPGGLGVTLFFFISGMLITRLLMAEHATQGRISLRRFYARRMIRLYPAMLIAVMLGCLLILAKGGSPWTKAASAVFYVANYYGIYVGWSQDFVGFDPLAVMWSLAVEEQYYIFFPLLCIALVRTPRRFLWVVVAAVVAALVWRVVLIIGGAPNDRIYLGTDTRIDSILYGGLLTLIFAQGKQIADRFLRLLSHPAVVLFGLLLLASTLVVRGDFFRETLRYGLQGIAFMPIISALCFSQRYLWAVRIFEMPFMRYFGRLSYSLYLMHAVAIGTIELLWAKVGIDKWQGGLLAPLCFVVSVVPLTMVLATLSYRYLELPLVRWRKQLGAHPVEGAEANPAASTLKAK